MMLVALKTHAIGRTRKGDLQDHFLAFTNIASLTSSNAKHYAKPFGSFMIQFRGTNESLPQSIVFTRTFDLSCISALRLPPASRLDRERQKEEHGLQAKATHQAATAK